MFATLAIVVLYGLHDPISHPDDILNRDVSALYNATHKIVWGACVCWVIFACATGNGGNVQIQSISELLYFLIEYMCFII